MEYEYPFKKSSEILKQSVWAKGEIIPNYPPSIWRWDKYGKVMKYNKHGNTNSEFGWEIDHIYPLAFGGSDDIHNLQPLQWKNNRAKSNSLNWNPARQVFAHTEFSLLYSWFISCINKISSNIFSSIRSFVKQTVSH